MTSTIAEAIAEHGFRKRRGEIFTADVSPGVLGWLGLNRATEHFPAGAFGVNPVVGVRNQQIEKLVAELSGRPFHPYSPPTIVTPVGYLMPEAAFRQWTVLPGTQTPAARQIADAVIDCGLPFMRSAADPAALAALIEKGTGYPHQLAFRRPLAWWLAGAKDRAIDIAVRDLEQLRYRNDDAGQELREYLRAFLDLLGKEGVGPPALTSRR